MRRLPATLAPRRPRRPVSRGFAWWFAPPVIVLLLPVIGLGVIGSIASAPAHRPVGAPPPALAARAVAFARPSGPAISGWLVPGKPGGGVLLLVHGIRADRRVMVARAAFLQQQGYTLLLIDLPAHGESAGERITFGVDEADGVRAAIAYLSRTFPDEKLGAIGVSLGAAALALAHPNARLSVMVLESMFPTIEDAVRDRLQLYLGPVGTVLTPLLLWQLPLRLGVSADQLRPIDALPRLHVPVLIAAGAVDRNTTLDETRRLYAAANAPKALWIVAGAAHQDLYAYDPPAYEATIGAFLGKAVGRPAPR